jgi:hypothetical protein
MLMKLLGMLFPLLGLVTLGAYIWLVVVAFKRSVGWGIGVLLLSPISAIVFAVKYWQESKKPFLLYIGSVSASIAMVFAMFAFVGGSAVMSLANQMQELEGGEVGGTEVAAFMEQQMDPLEESGQLDEEETPQTTGDAAQPATDPPPVESEPDSKLLPPVAQTPDPLPTEPATGTRTRDLVRMSDVSRHVGQVLRVVADNGRTFQGRLVADNGTVLMFEKHYSSGMITVPWNKSEIQSLYRVRKRPGS